MNQYFLEFLVKYLHFASIFAIILTVGGELFLIKPLMKRKELQRISRIDSIYGLASIILVAAGLTLWFGVGKPAEYYTKNWIFHLKWSLFAVVGPFIHSPNYFLFETT